MWAGDTAARALRELPFKMSIFENWNMEVDIEEITAKRMIQLADFAKIKKELQKYKNEHLRSVDFRRCSLLISYQYLCLIHRIWSKTYNHGIVVSSG